MTTLAVLGVLVALAWAGARWGCSHRYAVPGRYVREVQGCDGYRDSGRREAEPRFGLFCARCGKLIEDGGPVR